MPEWVLPATASVNHGPRFRSAAAAFIACLSVVPASPAAEAPTNAAPVPFLLNDRLGHATRVPTNEVPSSLHPPASIGLEQQIPVPLKGTPQADDVRDRILESKTGRQWLPPTPPVLMPYLANLDEYGNTAIQPGALFDFEPVFPAQAAKYALSDVGLRYSFYQSLTMVSMTDVASGASALQYYTATFFGKWAVTEVNDPVRANWLSTEANVQLGLSPASRIQSPQGNLGTVVNPLATVYGPNGAWMSELAWQTSLADGKVVVLAGLVDQSNYLDANTYANTSQGQFLNSALCNSSVLPLPYNNLGLNLQCQPSDRWYVMLGTGANNQAAGQSPFNDLGFDNWSYLLEFGLTPRNVLGLGSGVYRVQPFVATVHGVTQAGLGLNAQQQLGTNSPFGWFGRFGVGGSQVTLDGAAAQVATGIAMQAPPQYIGLSRRRSSDYAGVGFIWSRPSALMEPVAHQNEYGLEAMYLLQLTPFTSLQTDVQFIWNPAGNAAAERNIVFQLQLNLTW